MRPPWITLFKMATTNPIPSPALYCLHATSQYKKTGILPFYAALSQLSSRGGGDFTLFLFLYPEIRTKSRM